MLVTKIRFLPFLPLMMIFPAKIMAYPQVEMNACISSAVNSVVAKNLSATINELKGYCDCALRKVIDEGKEIKSSLYSCELKYLE